MTVDPQKLCSLPIPKGPEQLDNPVEGKLTQVSVTTGMSDAKVVRFVTDKPFKDALKMVIGIVTAMEEGAITQDDMVRNIWTALPNYPVFGNEAEIRLFVDCMSGYHIHVDCTQNAIFTGYNRNQDTWGRVGFGGRFKDVHWGYCSALSNSRINPDNLI